MVPIDDPVHPMTETALHGLELDRAADEGMIEPPVPEVDVPGTEVPGPEDEPRERGVEAPGPADQAHPGRGGGTPPR